MEVANDVRNAKLIAAITGLVAFVLFCLTPFLPVRQVQSSLEWPQNDTLNSVDAPLMSYSPVDLTVTVPLTAVDDLDSGHDTLFSTLPTDFYMATARGMFVRKTDSGVDVISRSRIILELPDDVLRELPKDAKLRITSTDSETTAKVVDLPAGYSPPQRPSNTESAALAKAGEGSAANSDSDESTNVTVISDDGLTGTLKGDQRPQVTGMYTSVKSEAGAKLIADGLNTKMTIDSRFTSSPTLLKYITMFSGLVLLVISLFALHRLDRLDGRRAHRFFPAGWWRVGPLDGLVTAMLLFWYFVGANTSDDGYLLNMARVSEKSGYMANYFRWFGVPESPFGAPYYDLLALMAKVSTTSTWMRLPELIAGIITWFVLSREILPRLGQKVGQRQVAQWTAAFVFLSFWMPYNNGLRPEPIIALGALLTWASMERAIATGRLLPAAIGVIIATISLGAGPTGLMAVAALLVSVSGLIKIVVRRLSLIGGGRGASRRAIIGAVLALLGPFLACGTAILLAVFGDQTLQTVLESIRLRGFIGPSLSWYQEPLRYEILVEPTVDGSFARRFAVLMMFLCLATVIAAILRNRTVPGAAAGPTNRLVLVIIGTMFFMAFTPTKWSHHFGVYAGIGAALGALAAMAVTSFAMQSLRNRILYWGGALFLLAFSLAGINGWWYVSTYGVPWYDKTVQINHIQASSVMLAISLIVMFVGVITSFRNDIHRARAVSQAEADQFQAEQRRRARTLTGLSAAPIAVISALVVVFSAASLAKGFVKQYPAYSVGMGNVNTLAGDQCQMANAVLVEPNPNADFLPTTGDTKFGESLTSEGDRGFEPNNIPQNVDQVDSDEASATAATVGSTLGAQSTSSGTDSTAGSSGTSSSGSTTSGDANATTGSTNGSGSGSATGNQTSNGSQKEESAAVADAANGRPGGINGSVAALPFGFNPAKVPVVGSYTTGVQNIAEATTAWYELPATVKDSPLIAVAAAGRVQHRDADGIVKNGQTLELEYGQREPNGEVTVMGTLQPLDPGPAPVWRDIRFLTDQLPPEANVVRIHAKDNDLTRRQWLAFTPPRLPQLETLNSFVGSDAPVLLDWVTGLQFPCQRPYDHWAGVAEVPQYRISPDHEARNVLQPWMDYAGGGALGLTEAVTTEVEVPSYLKDDWLRDWGEIDVLRRRIDAEHRPIKDAHVDEESVVRSGLWYPGPMNYKHQGATGER